MKKALSIPVSIALTLLLAVLAVGCNDSNSDMTQDDTTAEVTTTEAVTEATTENTDSTDTASDETEEDITANLGIFFESTGDYTLYAIDVPEEGLKFPISTSGDFAVECYAEDAEGNKLGDIVVEGGVIDYSAYPTAAKIVVIGGAMGGTYVHVIEEDFMSNLGIFFDVTGDMTLYGKDIPEEGLEFPISTSGDFAVECYAEDAEGNKLGDIEIEEGVIDYSAYPTAAKIVVKGGAMGGTYEHIIGQ